MNKNLQDHKNKCRCCFKQLKSAQKTVEISKFIEKRFQVLTGIKVDKHFFWHFSAPASKFYSNASKIF